MKLKRLEIKNFRNIKDLKLDFNEKTNSVCGKNGIGKTTIIDAIMWLLCDETFVYGKQNEDNKNKSNPKAVIELKGVFEKDNKKELTLERTYYEKWKDDEFEKNENLYKINGTKYKNNEYFERLRNEIGINYNTKVKGFNLLRCLIDSNYLDSIDYKIARKFIEERLELTSDEEIANLEQFNLIKDVLYDNNYDIEKVKSFFTNGKKETENEINKLENEIDLIESLRIDNDKELLEEKANKYKELLDENGTKKQEIIETTNKELNDIELQIEELQKDYLKQLSEYDNQIKTCINNGNKLKGDIENYQTQITILNKEQESDNYTIKLLQDNIDKDLELYNKTNESQFVETKCPECGFVLNQNEKETFESQKQETIKLLDEKIKNGKEHLEKFEKVKEKRIAQIKEYEDSIKKTQKQFDKEKGAYSKINEEKQQFMDNYSNEDIKVLDQKSNEIKEQSDKELQDLQVALIEIHNEYSSELNKLQESVDKEQLVDNKYDLLKEKKRTKARYELLLDNLEKFKQYKFKLTRENTKKVFPNIEFEMLEISVTGAIQECCHARYNNVEYAGLNNGNKYLIGVELIEDIKKALNVTEDLPIIFDRKADIDETNYGKLLDLTKAQIINTLVNNENEITIKGE